MSKTKHQAFNVQTVNRSEINFADYNPRNIDESNRKLLKKSLKEDGLVETLVWNKRTGNLLSGHQRLSILDELERGKEYALDVAVVDIDEKQEIALNIKLNNQAQQGHYDIEAILDLSQSYDLDLMGDFHFTEYDLQTFEGFGDVYQEPESVTKTAEETEKIKAERKRIRQEDKEEFTPNFYFIVVCRDREEKDEIFKKCNVPLWEKTITLEELKRWRER
ncbi:MAG: ParB N-terminal domain-containing protein [Defluviitaleaceae bacterium]|nr:ParB N-terminal domain-containing protein [Defluviitaleaceae bacterium]